MNLKVHKVLSLFFCVLTCTVDVACLPGLGDKTAQTVPQNNETTISSSQPVQSKRPPPPSKEPPPPQRPPRSKGPQKPKKRLESLEPLLPLSDSEQSDQQKGDISLSPTKQPPAPPSFPESDRNRSNPYDTHPPLEANSTLEQVPVRRTQPAPPSGDEQSGQSDQERFDSHDNWDTSI